MNSSGECLVMVDVSYYTKHSANAAWKKISEDLNLQTDENLDPMTIEEFRDSFTGHFIYGLDEIVRTHYPIHSGSNYLFCMDCKRPEVWRRSVFTGYKHNRESMKKKFSYSSIDEWVYRWIVDHSEKCGSRHIKVNGAEADDVFGTMVPYLLNKYQDIDVLIISGDSDLLQLGNDRVMQIDSHGEMVTIAKKLEKFKVSFDPTPENYLRFKIMIGDTSDGIPSIKYGKCGPKKAESLIKNIDEMVKFIKSEKEISEAFIRNATIIDLKHTPKILTESIVKEWEKFDEA